MKLLVVSEMVIDIVITISKIIDYKVIQIVAVNKHRVYVLVFTKHYQATVVPFTIGKQAIFGITDLVVGSSRVTQHAELFLQILICSDEGYKRHFVAVETEQNCR